MFICLSSGNTNYQISLIRYLFISNKMMFAVSLSLPFSGEAHYTYTKCFQQKIHHRLIIKTKKKRKNNNQSIGNCGKRNIASHTEIMILQKETSK